MFRTRIELLICAKCPSNAQLLMNSCLSSIDEVFTDFIILNLHVAYTQEELELLQKLIDTMEEAIHEAELSDDPRHETYLKKYYIDMASILIRSAPEYRQEAAELLEKAYTLISETDDENLCYHCMVSAWYYTLIEPDFYKMKMLTDRAAAHAEKAFHTDLEQIDIICVPTADCYCNHGEFALAEAKLQRAVNLCEQHPDMLPYVDKKIELMNFLLDVFWEMKDLSRLRSMITEIDRLNELYREQGICREVNPELRNLAMK